MKNKTVSYSEDVSRVLVALIADRKGYTNYNNDGWKTITKEIAHLTEHLIEIQTDDLNKTGCFYE